MKKNINIVILIIFVVIQTGCAGASDWKYTELPGDYEFIRSSARKISLAKADPDNQELADIIVDGYITQFMVYDEHIIITNEGDDSTQYHIVNTKDDSVQTYESLDELNKELDNIGMESKDEWTKTSELKKVK